MLGGGPVGCELAQFFQRIGSQVTLVQSDARLLPRVDADAAALVEEALREDGVEIRLDATRRGASERRRCRSPTARESAFDRLLVATGRRPNVDGLEPLGLEIRGAGSRSTSGCARRRTSGRSAT